VKPRFYLLRVTHNDVLDLLEAVRTQAFYESERAKRLRSLEILLERKHKAISYEKKNKQVAA
jgi:hypothetical protein